MSPFHINVHLNLYGPQRIRTNISQGTRTGSWGSSLCNGVQELPSERTGGQNVGIQYFFLHLLLNHLLVWFGGSFFYGTYISQIFRYLDILDILDI